MTGVGCTSVSHCVSPVFFTIEAPHYNLQGITSEALVLGQGSVFNVFLEFQVQPFSVNLWPSPWSQLRLNWIFKAGSDEDSVDNERPPLCNFGQSTNQSKHWSDVGRRERGMQYSSPSSSSSSSSLWWWWSSGGLHIIPIQCKRQKNSIKRKEVATVFASYIILICFRICTSPGNILTLLAHFFQYNQAFIIQQSTKGVFF